MHIAAAGPPPAQAKATPLDPAIREQFARRINFPFDDPVPWVGSQEAPINIMVFSDYGCMYCGLQNLRLKRLQAAHPKQVKLTFRQLPAKYNSEALFASKAALAAARQHKFAEFNTGVYDRRGQISGYAMYALARELQLDNDQFRNDVADPSIAARIAEDVALADSVPIPGTPSFLINGRLILGIQSAEELEQLVREEKDLVDAIVASGVAVADVQRNIHALIAG